MISSAAANQAKSPTYHVRIGKIPNARNSYCMFFFFICSRKCELLQLKDAEA